MLRSVNVGGRNRLSMGDLRTLAASLGFADVSTYLQSGNMVFTASGPAEAAARALEDRMAAELDLSVPVVVRSGPQLREVVDSTPYGRFLGEPTTVHVTFLAGGPDPAGVQSLRDRAEEFGGDRFAVIGTEVHLHCPGGYGETKLTNAYLERRLGVTATTRNWKTVAALADLADPPA